MEVSKEETERFVIAYLYRKEFTESDHVHTDYVAALELFGEFARINGA